MAVRHFRPMVFRSLLAIVVVNVIMHKDIVASIRLTQEQSRSIAEMQQLIQNIENNPSLLSEYQEPIINFTSWQVYKISKRKTDFFTSKDELSDFDLAISTSTPVALTTEREINAIEPASQASRNISQEFGGKIHLNALPDGKGATHDGHMTSTGFDTGGTTEKEGYVRQGLNSAEVREHERYERHARTRNAVVRVCKAKVQFASPVLALDTRGKLVQVVQLPGDQRQMFFHETCERTTCDGIELTENSRCSCQEEETKIKAYVVDLANSRLRGEWVKAHRQCIAKRVFG